VLSTPPAFVLSQNQTLQTKTPGNKPQQNPNQNKPDLTSQQTGKKGHTPTRGRQDATQKQKQQTKTTKHTIEFSNNTPSLTCEQGNPASLSHRTGPGQILGSKALDRSRIEVQLLLGNA